MALATGSHVGPYEILGLLGAGGMGEVYRARDERLKREVAIKVLPASLSADSDRVRRFEQEAQAAGSLNHPNILSIYDIGTHEGSLYVVSELLEGETLRDRVSGGPFSPRKALGHALQVAHGLAAAHEKGIVHRDLKPENVFVTKDGRVKILDFGLAKLAHPREDGSVSQLATMGGATQPGVVLGTLGYMSPEQVRGKPADARSDIFSFGAILHEMLSGRRAFSGDSAADVVSAILTKDPPDLSLTNQAISPGLERVVRHCLEKDPEQRFHSAHDLAFDLEALLGVSSGTSPVAAPGSGAAVWPRRLLPVLAALLAAALLAVFGLRLAGYRVVKSPAKDSGAAPGGLRAEFTQLTSAGGIECFPSVSPDGKTFVFVSEASGNADIYLQRVDGANAINLTKDSPEDDTQPAFSPDGSQIAFRSERGGGGIFVMGATGESVRRVSDFGYNPTWSPDASEIAVAMESIVEPLNRRSTSELWAVKVATGEKRRITAGDAVQPNWSPHGDRIAYWGLPKGSGQRDIWTIPASGTGPAVPVTHDPAVDWNPVWSPAGDVLYFVSNRGGTMNLWRVGIDEKTGKTAGDPAAMSLPSRSTGHFSVSRDGRRILYAAEETTSDIRKVAFDPARIEVVGPSVSVRSGTLLLRDIASSPDGKWVAFTTRGEKEDLFLISADGSALRQLTNDRFRNRGPRFSPDGKRIAFYTNRSGRYEIWSIAPDGSGLAQLTQTDGAGIWFPQWSPDASRLAFPDGTNTFFYRLGKPLGSEKADPLPPPPDGSGAFLSNSWSADGKSLAGVIQRRDSSIVPGTFVYDIERKAYRKVSDDGVSPVWLSDGRRLLGVDSALRHLVVIDAASGRKQIIMEAPFIGMTLFGKLAISADDRTIFYLSGRQEADIWQVTLR